LLVFRTMLTTRVLHMRDKTFVTAITYQISPYLAVAGAGTDG
jgi:hypothetical protein